MNLARHYKILGLRRGASSEDVKRAYRRLVRQYHPDINPDKEAIEQFIAINDAYTAVLEAIAAAAIRRDNRKGIALDRLNSIRNQLEKLGLGHAYGAEEFVESKPTHSEPIRGGYEEVSIEAPVEISNREVAIANERISVDSKTVQTTDRTAQAAQTAVKPLSAEEETLKRDAYGQLKGLLSQQKFPLAIALVEGLAHRMPTDLEISQWQAIVYQRWGRMLILQGQHNKARIYLKKALRTDPNNQSLWSEVNRDFWHLASLGHQSRHAV